MARKEGSLQAVARSQSVNRARGQMHKDRNIGIAEMKSEVVHSVMTKERCTQAAC